VNKSSLVREVSGRLGDGPDVASVVDAVLDVIRDAVAKGERVSLSGFGTFDRVRRSPRTGRNPHTGDPVQIPARNAPVFRAGAAFRDAVAAPRGKRTTGRRGARTKR
jgi:DNA-binding protein HU-beta